MDKITSSKAAVDEALDEAYRKESSPDSRTIATAIVWAGFQISEGLSAIAHQIRQRPH